MKYRFKLVRLGLLLAPVGPRNKKQISTRQTKNTKPTNSHQQHIVSIFSAFICSVSFTREQKQVLIQFYLLILYCLIVSQLVVRPDAHTYTHIQLSPFS